MGLVLGIGSGLFALIILWIIGLVLCVVFSRVAALRIFCDHRQSSQMNHDRSGVVGIGILVLGVTFILIFYPRETTEDVEEKTKQPIDNLSVVRTTVFVAACLFAVISLVLMLIFHWMEPQYAPALLARKKYVF